MFLEFNFQFYYTDVSGPLVRLLQEFLPEGFTAETPTVTDFLELATISYARRTSRCCSNSSPSGNTVLGELANELKDICVCVRAGMKGYFGADSSGYEQAGGTRSSEHKKPTRKAASVPAAK